MRRAAQPFGLEPGEVLVRYYEELLRQFGPQGWWPARTRLEVILGAILTQNTNWQNAARAIGRLRASGFLRWQRLRRATAGEIEECIRPAGYFRQKARTIRTFVDWLNSTHQGSLDALFNQPPELARVQLLDIRGLGPETADAILLYAGNLPFSLPMPIPAVSWHAMRFFLRTKGMRPLSSFCIDTCRLMQDFLMSSTLCWLKSARGIASGRRRSAQVALSRLFCLLTGTRPRSATKPPADLPAEPNFVPERMLG